MTKPCKLVNPHETTAAVSTSRRYMLLIAAFAMLGASFTVYEINFANFLRERYDVGEWFRGFLEFPRESQGFAVVFYVVALGTLTERRLFTLAAILTAVGLVALAMLPPRLLADNASGILPGMPMILALMVHSAGFHLSVTMQNCIILDHGELADAGTRLGKVGFWVTLAALLAAGLVWLLRHCLTSQFQFFFVLAAVLALSAVVAMGRAMRRLPAIHPLRRRFVFKRKFLRYYVLSALFGVRKQVFITFAPWVLVTIYAQDVDTFAKLWLTTSIVSLVAKPMIGRLIDRFGPRRTLTIDAHLLVAVCLLYGYSEHLFANATALAMVLVIFIVDHVLFFAGTARAIYASAVATDSNELASTLSLGSTIDHVFSMSVPLAGGLIWKAFGYEYVFIMAAGVAVMTAIAASGLPGAPHGGTGRLATAGPEPVPAT